LLLAQHSQTALVATDEWFSPELPGAVAIEAGEFRDGALRPVAGIAARVGNDVLRFRPDSQHTSAPGKAILAKAPFTSTTFAR
jgi:hypothetical protein